MKDDRGFTLVDLLFAITIGSIVLLGIGSVLLTGYSAVRGTAGPDLGVLIAYLDRDVGSAEADPGLVALAPDGTSITIAVPDRETGVVQRITYAYTGAAGTDPGTTSGAITRTVRSAEGPPSTLTLVRQLDATFRGPIFECAPAGATCARATGVTARIAASTRGEAVVRTVSAAFRTQLP